MDLISPFPCRPEDRPHLPAAREALVGELEQRGRVALAALLPVLLLLWATLRRAAQADRRIAWLLLAALAMGLLRIAAHGLPARSMEMRHLRFTVGSTLLALLLGATTWLAFPRLSPIEMGLLGMIDAGLGSAALVSMAPSPVTYLAYILPMLGSLGLASILHPAPEHPFVFLTLIWLFLGALSVLSVRVHRSLRDEILLRLRSREQALRDTLTGLHNRRFLAEFMEHETAQALRNWSQPGSRPLTLKLILLDIDHFKEVNDLHGHEAGDAVLKQLASLLREVVRRPDVVVRWGGEEFIIVARDTGRELPLGLAERIRQRVSAHPFQLPGGEVLRRTCSLGFSLYPFLPDAPSQIGWEPCVALADAGLYLAKEGGRDRWVGLEAGPEPWADPRAVLQAVQEDPAAAEAKGWVRLVRQEG
ncbi:MAG TPA: GGDEF domain-containing protein [Holophagaceae bacterium]|nr:GGDEF domain-containing protein [Holophagaceae bacterium]